jgi:hypothetical protein
MGSNQQPDMYKKRWMENIRMNKDDGNGNGMHFE